MDCSVSILFWLDFDMIVYFLDIMFNDVYVDVVFGDVGDLFCCGEVRCKY